MKVRQKRSLAEKTSSRQGLPLCFRDLLQKVAGFTTFWREKKKTIQYFQQGVPMPKFLDAPQWYDSSGSLVTGIGEIYLHRIRIGMSTQSSWSNYLQLRASTDISWSSSTALTTPLYISFDLYNCSPDLLASESALITYFTLIGANDAARGISATLWGNNTEQMGLGVVFYDTTTSYLSISHPIMFSMLASLFRAFNTGGSLYLTSELGATFEDRAYFLHSLAQSMSD